MVLVIFSIPKQETAIDVQIFHSGPFENFNDFVFPQHDLFKNK